MPVILRCLVDGFFSVYGVGVMFAAAGDLIHVAAEDVAVLVESGRAEVYRR